MPPDEKSRAESAPYVLTEDELLDDRYDYEPESYEQRYGPPTTSRRASAEVGGASTGQGYLTPTNLILFAVAMAVGFWAVTSDVFVSGSANVAGAVNNGGAGNIA